MTAVIAKILPRASAAQLAAIDSFVSIAFLSGFGLLVSVGVVILDQLTPGEWF
jgi:hypothetical protein